MKRHAKALIAVSFMTMLLGASSASASQSHQQTGFLAFQENPHALAVDQDTGDVYVLDANQATISRYDSSGNPLPFSALNGSNVINGSDAGPDADQTPANGFSLDSSSQIAVDASGTATDGNVYLADSANNVIDVFAESGEYIGQLSGVGTNSAEPSQSWAESFAYPCGVAVDANGALYVATAFAGHIERYVPAGATPADSDLASHLTALPFGTCGLDVDSAGDLYAAASAFGGPGVLSRYAAGSLHEVSLAKDEEDADNPPVGTTIDPSATAIAVDPSNDDLYVDNGNEATHYDSSGAKVAGFIGTLADSHGIAIDASGTATDGNAYIADSGAVLTYGPALLTVPDSTTEAADAITGTSATLHGQVDPDGEAVTDCRFQYGTDTTYTNAEGGPQSIPCAQTPDEIGSGSGPVAVSAELSGLTHTTEYHFRLIAANANGQGPAGEDQSFSTPDVAPILAKAFVTEIGISSATLKATIDPAGFDTTYRFEYVTLAEFEANGFANATQSPDPDGEVKASAGNTTVSANLIELSPETTYRFRLLATNAIGTSEGQVKGFTTFALPSTEPDSCPNAAIRAEQGAQNVGDCRAFELVSPVQKNGGEVMVDPLKSRAASEGDAVTFASLSAFGDSVGGGLSFEYMGVRTASGWQAHSIMPPQEPGDPRNASIPAHPQYLGELSGDLSTGVFRSVSPLTEAPNVATTHNLYLRTDLRSPGPGSYQLLSDAFAPVPAYHTFPNVAGYRPGFADASADFSHVIFESPLNLTAEATGTFIKLYEWVNGTVRLAGILPNGDPAECEPGVVCSVAGRGAFAENYTFSTISRDGRRIFFSSPVSLAGDLTPHSQLYMRLDGAETVHVNASERTSPEEQGGATFWGASADGLKVFFTSAEKLTDDDDNGISDLYEYDASRPDSDPDNLRRLSFDPAPGGGSGALRIGVIGTSEDGEYVYFAAEGGQLVSGARPFEVGRGGIYLFHDGALRFIGDVANMISLVSTARYVLTPLLARVTPDGTRLAFEASDGEGLTDDDTSCPPAGPCTELYLYDAEANGGAGKLECASCPPSGAPASTSANVLQRNISQGNTLTSSHLSRFFSEDGKRVFFMSGERLVPEDRNGGVQDVYEYDAEAGSVRLISTGTGTEPSYLLDASASGDDVFIATRERLVGKDTGKDLDVYDVRVGGGFPEPPPSPICEGDSCLVAPSPPQAPTPASSAFRGAGNQSARKARCAKGKRRVRRKGRARCVRAHKAKKHKRNANSERRAGK